MTVIRGATTIERDDKEEIRKAVSELLEQIERRNSLKRDEIVSIVFSSTSDIHSFYPAKAAREAGFGNVSLFSAQEPDIDGGLALCIRVMAFIEKNVDPRHVYLRGAKILRKDLSSVYNVAIDGPAGSGKSTLAKALAKSCHILYLDTGAMYRACGLKALRQKTDLSDEAAVCDLMKNTSVDIRYMDGEQKTYLDGEEVSALIRDPEVSSAASAISKHPFVRSKMAEKQREIAAKSSCVLDGRDIGTYVLPGADFKFFLTASPQVRAKRRYDELTERGCRVTLEDVEREMRERDEQDAARAVAPLRKADDAVEIDTSDMTAEEVLEALKRKIQEKI